jgi:hypothetical protein
MLFYSEIHAKFACVLAIGLCLRADGFWITTFATLTQSLVLAPQLQQSLALLQAPTLELKALVEQELQQNPVLEEIAEQEMELPRKIARSKTSAKRATPPPRPIPPNRRKT